MNRFNNDSHLPLKIQALLNANSNSMKLSNPSPVLSPMPTYFPNQCSHQADSVDNNAASFEDYRDYSNSFGSIFEKTVSSVDFQKVKPSFQIYNKNQSLSFKPSLDTQSSDKIMDKSIYRQGQNNTSFQTFKQSQIEPNRPYNMKILSKITFEIISEEENQNFKKIAKELSYRLERLNSSESYFQKNQKQSVSLLKICPKQKGEEQPTQRKDILKNTRRRLYDIFNVLKAANIITLQHKYISIKKEDFKCHPKDPTKEKKIDKLIQQFNEKKMLLENKKQCLRQLSEKYQSMKALIERNSKMKKSNPLQRIQFPMIVIETCQEVNFYHQKEFVHFEAQKKVNFYADLDCLNKICLQSN